MRAVDVERMAEIAGAEVFDPVWLSWSFGGKWGNRLTKHRNKKAGRGGVISGDIKDNSIKGVYNRLIRDDDFTNVANFYVGFIAFYGKELLEHMVFEGEGHTKITGAVGNQVCPVRYKEIFIEMCEQEFDFLDFIDAAYESESTNFDKESAIEVYKCQGRDAIFGLLCQMFYHNKAIDLVDCCLIDGVGIELSIEVSNYLSGCYFPVVVSPCPEEYEWREGDNGWYLYGRFGDEWLVTDVAGVGRVCLAGQSLSNRINYLGGGGQALPYIVCWNWGEVIEAYHFFGGDLLVRDLKNSLFSHYWFVFGPDSLLNVRLRDGLINYQEGTQIEPGFKAKLKNGRGYVIVNLRNELIDYCQKEDVFFSDSEVWDWFHIAKQIL